MRKPYIMLLAIALLASLGVADEQRAKLIGNNASLLLTKTLLGEVKKQLKSKDPKEVVTFCSEKAEEITHSIHDLLPEGVRLKRTSTKLRNSNNTMLEGEREVFEEFESRLAKGELSKRSYKLATNGSGYKFYKPIIIEKPCLQCHGQKEELAEGVSASLAKLYPNDEATGYAKGDLRGLVVVDMPQSCL